jgi:hypothetical protein
VDRILLKRRSGSSRPRHVTRRAIEEEEFSSEDDDLRSLVDESPIRDNVDHDFRRTHKSPHGTNGFGSSMGPPEGSRKRSYNDMMTGESTKKRKRKETGVDSDGKPTSKQAAWYRTPFDVIPKFASFLGQDKISRADGKSI